MKKKIMTLSLCLVLLLTTACGNKTKLKNKNGEEIVASVDGLKISAEDLYQDLKVSGGYERIIARIDNYIANKEISDSEDINVYVNNTFEDFKTTASTYNTDTVTFFKYYFISNIMSESDIKSYQANIATIETEDEIKEYLENQYKLSLAIEKQIGESITDEEIENYYNEKYSEILTVKHILIEFDEDDDTFDEAYNTALNIIGKLNETEKDKLNEKFDSLAYEYSADSSYNNGGLIENFVAGEVVTEFYEASTNLEDNEYTKVPVKTQFGYHVILKVSEKEKPSLDTAKEDIRKKLAEQALSSNATLQYKALKELREKYNISFNDSEVGKSYNEFLEQISE